MVTEGSAPAVSASQAATEPEAKSSKKKGTKSADPDEDRSNDPTLGIGRWLSLLSSCGRVDVT